MLKKTGLLIAIIGLSTGFGMVYAHHHITPGVDRPYDPVDYYSQTSISYADSPSTFFYKDLASGGNAVLDITRKIKSALFGSDFSNLITVFSSKTANDTINTTPFSNNTYSVNTENLNSINSTTTSNAISPTISGNTLFRSFKNNDDASSSYDEGSQAVWLSNTYESFAESAKNSLNDVEKQYDTLNQMLDNSNSAEGDLQANQASAQIKALNVAEMARRNTLLSNSVNMTAVSQMQQVDDNLNGIRTTENTGGYFADPYNQKEYDYANYTHAAAPGFKDF